VAEQLGTDCQGKETTHTFDRQRFDLKIKTLNTVQATLLETKLELRGIKELIKRMPLTIDFRTFCLPVYYQFLLVRKAMMSVSIHTV
jgi:hypothetical protein